MGKLVEIWRHPIKSHGREQVRQIDIKAGQTLPGDREFVVIHEKSKVNGKTWAPCLNFSRAAKAPSLMAIKTKWDQSLNLMTLSHPDLPMIVINPDKYKDQTRFISWAANLVPASRMQPYRLLRTAERGMTDTSYASITIGNMASNRAIAKKMGRKISHLRWRCNLWLDQLGPWEEFGWVGKNIKIGNVIFEVRERVERCLATNANPETGQRDADTLGALETWGHRDFTVAAIPKTNGPIRIDDPVIIA